MDRENRNDVSAVFGVEVIEVRGVLEVVGQDGAVLYNIIGDNIVAVLLDIQGDVLRGQNFLGNSQDLSVGSGGSGNGDGLTGQSGVIEVGIIAIAGVFYNGDNGTIILFGDVIGNLLAGEGGGEDMPKMQAKAQELGIADHVRFLGVRSDVADLMQAMDVFAFPSLYEGLPVTMVEAQAAGLPCIISDKVPPECILTEGLVDVLPLSAGAEAWADAILEKRNTPRTDRSAEIAAHGFDITTEAVKLQEFYLSAYEKNC